MQVQLNIKKGATARAGSWRTSACFYGADVWLGSHGNIFYGEQNRMLEQFVKISFFSPNKESSYVPNGRKGFKTNLDAFPESFLSIF